MLDMLEPYTLEVVAVIPSLQLLNRLATDKKVVTTNYKVLNTWLLDFIDLSSTTVEKEREKNSTIQYS